MKKQQMELAEKELEQITIRLPKADLATIERLCKERGYPARGLRAHLLRLAFHLGTRALLRRSRNRGRKGR